jgi:hypothetical protein
MPAVPAVALSGLDLVLGLPARILGKRAPQIVAFLEATLQSAAEQALVAARRHEFAF